MLFKLGDFVQNKPKTVILVAFFLLSLCLIGLKDVQIETDLVKLWVERKFSKLKAINLLKLFK